MFYVYILLSEKDGVRYIGCTSKQPLIRLAEHNSNKGNFTRGHQPWVLVHHEEFADKVAAHKREIFLKSGQGRKWVDMKLKK
ncbi:MAG: GIY-YIG nuclease family protein [Patescibacteria group bacterium]